MEVNAIKPYDEYVSKSKSMSEEELIGEGIHLENIKENQAEELAYTLGKYECIKDVLIEKLHTQEKDATAVYTSIGQAVLTKPRLFASYLKENEETVFSFLRGSQRDDLIKLECNKKSLSSFVAKSIEAGQVLIPEITYYLKPDIKFKPVKEN